MKIDVGGEGGATPPRKDLYSITTTRTPRQATASNRAAAQASSSVDGGVDRRATERGAALLNGTGDGTGGEGKKEGSGGGGAVNKRPLGRAVPLEELEQQGEEGCDDFSKDGSNTALIELGGGSTASVSLDLKRSRLAPPSPGESNHNSPDHTTTTAQQALHHQAPRSGATVLTTLRPTAAVEAAAGSARLVALAAGGDPCPTCSNNASAGNHFGWTCRCGWANAGDKARGGFTGGEPVAAAGARFGAAATAATDDGVGGGTTESVVQPVAVGDGRGAAGRVSVRGNGSAGVVEVTVTPGLGGRVGLSGVNGVALSDGHQQQPEQQQFQFPSGESEDKVMVDVEAEGADVIMRDAGNRLGGREERILLNDAVAPSSPSVQQSVTSPVVTPKTATLTAEAAAAAAAAAGAAGLLPHQTKTFAGGGAAAAATRETVGGAQVMVKSESNVKGGGPTASLTPPTATAVMMMAPSPSPWAHQQHQQQQLQYQQQQIQLQQLQQQAFQQQQLQMQQQRQLMQLQQEAEAAAAAAGGQVASGGLESLPVMMMPSCPKNSTTAVTMISQGGISGGDARLLTEPDTMDRLAQSLAQAHQLTLSVEARQTELLSRPKRRSHPSSKKEGAAQSRKVRPKNGVTAAAAAATAASSNANRGSLKLEELSTVKTEEPSLSPTVADCSVTGAAIGAGASSVAAAGAVATANRASDAKPKPKTKHRLLIKIPRSAVNAATAHAAEMAAAERDAVKAAGKANGKAGGKGGSKGKAGSKGGGGKSTEKATREGESGTKRGGKGGKGGVKRARPLAGTRAPPPPPPPAPTSRQELPPGCGPPSPGLKGIFGHEMDESELEGATDGVEHLAASTASKRLTALSSAMPKELASHVQALRLDYLVQKVRPILTKLMSAGTGPQRGLFNVPVDPVKLGIPDYFKRVPHPMDLGTVKARLLSMGYTSPEAFAADIRLVFTNAISFNPESHFVHTWAVHLLNEFDQEYSKQLGKLDENWAKSLNHSCQLCQGQTCTLCGDKCLKLEPPVIICQHCNKRVVRGGVYHITRDGCRLWCSRCHPGLPPELPIDGDPETLAGSEGGDADPITASGGTEAAGEGNDAGGPGAECGGGEGVSARRREGENEDGQPQVGADADMSAREDVEVSGGVLVNGGGISTAAEAGAILNANANGARSASSVSIQAVAATAVDDTPSVSASAALPAAASASSSSLPTPATSSPAPRAEMVVTPAAQAVRAVLSTGVAMAGVVGPEGRGSGVPTVSCATEVAAAPLGFSSGDARRGSDVGSGTGATGAGGQGGAARSGPEVGGSTGGGRDTPEPDRVAAPKHPEAGAGAGAGSAPMAAVAKTEAEAGAKAGAGATVEFPPLRKRDLLRRKFDEEISEPWVQCDRCNSWVHQVCALFNARSNVGESTFVCPLCRLGDLPVARKGRETKLSAAENHYAARKRSKSESPQENGHLTPLLLAPTKPKNQGCSGAASTSSKLSASTAAGSTKVTAKKSDGATTTTTTTTAIPSSSSAPCAAPVTQPRLLAVTPAPAAHPHNPDDATSKHKTASPPAAAMAGVGVGGPLSTAPGGSAPLAISSQLWGSAAVTAGLSSFPSASLHRPAMAAGAPGKRGSSKPAVPTNGVPAVTPCPRNDSATTTVVTSVAAEQKSSGEPSSLPPSTPHSSSASVSPLWVTTAPVVTVHDDGDTEVHPVVPALSSASASASAVVGPVVTGSEGGPAQPAGGDASGATSSGAGGAAVTLPGKLAAANTKANTNRSVMSGNSDRVSMDMGAEVAPAGAEGEVCGLSKLQARGGGGAADTAGLADDIDVYAASSLPHTPLSRYIEARVRQRLAKLEGVKVAETVRIRMISNVEATCEVHPVLRETFCCKDGQGVGPNKNDIPELLKYRSKALSMFQRVDGVEVCLFSMYVQEYGADAPYFNAKRAYISYLDSVEYFRPRKHRTAVYHEILVAYLDWLRRRGFKAAHIWSCPPQRGNNFIFWCHPLHQKTPTRDRLSGWYGNMLKRAVQLGVAAKVTTLDKTHFGEVEKIGILLKNRRTSAAASAAASLAGVKGPDDLPLRPEVPVIFDGDFWAEEAVRLARQVDRRDEGAEETQTPLEICRQALEELIRHQQGAPFTAPVDPARDRCPDYLAVITTPMDLGTVAETLDRMQYHDAGAFVADVRLIFENAKKYNPPKHPIHVAATKLSKVFDKTVRALENAVNRLPGMHDMGLENLILEEPAPPTPTTPGAGGAAAAAAAAAVDAATAAAAAAVVRPTAPGKSSIPWEHDAVGPLSQLARQTWAALRMRTARTVEPMPTMMEDSVMDVAGSTTPHSGRTLGGSGGISRSTSDLYESSSATSGPERMSRSLSTAVMSVSEFYGPSGARMLQRRGSTASALSFTESYGVEGEDGAGRGRNGGGGREEEEQREGEEALSMLMANGRSEEGEPGGSNGTGSGSGGSEKPAVGSSIGPGSSIPQPPDQSKGSSVVPSAALPAPGAAVVTTVPVVAMNSSSVMSAVSKVLDKNGGFQHNAMSLVGAVNEQAGASAAHEHGRRQTPSPTPSQQPELRLPGSTVAVATQPQTVEPTPPAVASAVVVEAATTMTSTTPAPPNSIWMARLSPPRVAAAAAAAASSSVAVAVAPAPSSASSPPGDDRPSLALLPPLMLDPPHPASAVVGGATNLPAPRSGSAAVVMAGQVGISRLPWVVTPPSSSCGSGVSESLSATAMMPITVAAATMGDANCSSSGGTGTGSLTRQQSCQFQKPTGDSSAGAEQQPQQRQSRAMSVDSASRTVSSDHDASTNVTWSLRARTMSVGAVPHGNHSPAVPSPVGSPRGAGCRSDALGLTVRVSQGSGSNGSSVARLTSGSGPHSPRLRAQSIDSTAAKGERKKGKSKRGKGPGTAVMGKADRIGRMLQSLSRAVTRISKDLLVVTLGEPDRPARPPPARAGSGMTTEQVLAELESWHASSGLDGVLTPDCHDPDPPISRALVDARHTFLEMCQFRHYQFDTLRRAKHSSAMVLYHLHRPESRSLNPFCSRCHRPVRFVRYHCGVCNYDLCSACDEEVSTKCEDGHDLTPYRVTFSTEDAEKSPAAGRTSATGGTSLSPRRLSRLDVAHERGSGSGRMCAGLSTSSSRNARSGSPPAAGVTVPSRLPLDDRLFSTSPQPRPTLSQRCEEGAEEKAVPAAAGSSVPCTADASAAPSSSTLSAAVSLSSSLVSMDVCDGDASRSGSSIAISSSVSNGALSASAASSTGGNASAALSAGTEFVLRTPQNGERG